MRINRKWLFLYIFIKFSFSVNGYITEVVILCVFFQVNICEGNIYLQRNKTKLEFDEGLRIQIPLDYDARESGGRSLNDDLNNQKNMWFFMAANGNKGLLSTEDVEDHKSQYKFAKSAEKCFQCNCGMRFTKRGQDGAVTQSLEFPWIGIILYRNAFYCTGSLITNQFVIASGHCTHNRDLPFISVRFFADKPINSRAQVVQRTISMIYRPLAFDETTYDRDISVLKLSAPVPILTGYIRPICLPAPGTSYGGLFGITVTLQKTNADRPVFAKREKFRLSVYTNADCRKNVYGKAITPFMLCAGDSKGQNNTNCLHDRGSPLMVVQKNRFTLAGVSSWGIQCVEAGYPAVFSRVTKFLDFITKIISDSCSCS